MTTSTVTLPVVSVTATLVYKIVEVRDEHDNITLTKVLDREASIAAFENAALTAEERRVNGSKQLREAVSKVFAELGVEAAPTPDVIMGACCILNTGAGANTVTLLKWKDEVTAFITENTASLDEGVDPAGHLYCRGKGRGGLQLVTDKFLAARALASVSDADKAAREADKAARNAELDAAARTLKDLE